MRILCKYLRIPRRALLLRQIVIRLLSGLLLARYNVIVDTASLVLSTE
jgi:hypothetical protein